MRAPPSILRALRGYSLPFENGTPHLSMPSAASFSHLRDPVQARVVDEEVEALLLKGAIEEVVPSCGYYSKVFVVTKKDGGWRPILNIKRLNKEYLVSPKFKMDTVRDVASLLREGDWTASIDLKDAYFHIPVAHRFRRFLRFGWRGRLYQYLVIPFGLCVAPWLFTRVTAPLKAWLRARGIRSIFYLDDILIIGSTKAECQANLDIALALLRDVGFIVNIKKSSLTPSTNFRFLGLRWDTLRATMGVDEDKRLKLTSFSSRILLSTSLTCHALQKFLGLATSQLEAVPLLRLRTRFLQRDLNRVYVSKRDSS